MLNIPNKLNHINERYLQHLDTEELKKELFILVSEIEENETSFNAKSIEIGDIASDKLYAILHPNEVGSKLIKTGFVDYDRLTGGLCKGEFVVIGARPGMGKTQFMVNTCVNIAKSGVKCGFLSLELGAELLTNRFIANLSKFAQQTLAKRPMSDDELQLVKNSVSELIALPIFIQDKGLNSMVNLIHKCKELVNERKVEIIFIDYLQLVGGINRRYSRETELGVICREIKKVAKELDIAIVVSSQLSRQVENRPGGSRRPQLSDLRESGAIEQDADKVLFLYRSEYYGIEVDENNQPTRGMMEVIIAKNKTGPSNEFYLKADKYFSGFTDYMNEKRDIHISKDRLDDIF